MAGTSGIVYVNGDGKPQRGTLRIVHVDDGPCVVENTITGEIFERTCATCYRNTSTEPRRTVTCDLMYWHEERFNPLMECSECIPLALASKKRLEVRDELIALASKNEGELLNCIYRFINYSNEIIYIGKAKDLKKRLKNHKHLSDECYSEIWKIEYCEFNSEYDMDFAERYFIPKVSPKYNTVLSNRSLGVCINELDEKIWYEFR